MGRTIVKISLLFAALSLGACAENLRQETRIKTAPFYVPATMQTQTASNNPAQPGINPYQLLPTSEAEDFFVPRGEKVAFGSTILGESSAYSIYTYDQQLISTIWGPSYRYRWIVQQGITSP